MFNAAVAQNMSVDRLEVFISSTIGECAVQRTAVRRAIQSLNFVPVQFEREGARAEAPREFYLRKLQTSHIVVAIYRNSYGWVDAAKGMAISGLEDEYRETIRLEKDLLAYVQRDGSGRDPRLTSIVEEIMSGPNVIYFFDEDEDLEILVRDDLTALVSDRVARYQNRRLVISSAADVLNSIFRKSPFRIRRAALLESLTKAAAFSRIVWIIGPAGAGKTALAAEWAEERAAAYVNARGLDPRTTLLSAARALGIASDAELAVPVFDDARALLASRWQHGRNWPLVIDAPEEIDSIWAVLGECLSSVGIGSVVITAKDVPPGTLGQQVQVTGFTADELDALHAVAGTKVITATEGELPLTLRYAGTFASLGRNFEGLNSLSREILGYLALSPSVLGIEDLLDLLGNAVSSTIELNDRIDELSDLVMDSAGGFEFIHENYRDSIAETLQKRPQLKALLTTRLTKRMSRTGRSWAAFVLSREGDPTQTEKLANLTVQESVFTGSTHYLVDALEFLKSYYEGRVEKGRLVAVLMSLADTYSGQGKFELAFASLSDALQIAKEIGDDEARCMLEILKASMELRRFASLDALYRVTALRHQARTEGRRDDEARLLLEEGTALLSANEPEAAIPVYREALAIFSDIGNDYGIEITTRNLIASLGSTKENIAESDRLRHELEKNAKETPRYRAWLCNLLVPRLRRDKRYVEAEAMAREAISIGEELGDRYLVAINLIVLGNVHRDAGQIFDASQAYANAGDTAKAIGRKDIEGRSLRLRALLENEIAQESAENKKQEHAELAITYATHAADIFAKSYAWFEYGSALEERGDANRLLGRKVLAESDYADATLAFFRAKSEDDVERLLGFLVRYLDDESKASSVIGKAFGASVDDSLGGSELWVRSFVAVIDSCPKQLMPSVLGVLIRNFFPGGEGKWWFECLIHCLLAASRRSRGDHRTGVGSLVLIAILGYSKYRDLSVDNLTILATICGRYADRLSIKYSHGSDLDLTMILGKRNQVLFSIHDEAKVPETVFASLFIGAFLDAFSEDIEKIFFENGESPAFALELISFSQSVESSEILKFMNEGLKDSSISFARTSQESNEKFPIVALLRQDAIHVLKADAAQGGPLEIMLAKFLDQVLYCTLGGSLDDEIYRSKSLELLIRVLR